MSDPKPTFFKELDHLDTILEQANETRETTILAIEPTQHFGFSLSWLHTGASGITARPGFPTRQQAEDFAKANWPNHKVVSIATMRQMRAVKLEELRAAAMPIRKGRR